MSTPTIAQFQQFNPLSTDHSLRFTLSLAQIHECRSAHLHTRTQKTTKKQRNPVHKAQSHIYVRTPTTQPNSTQSLHPTKPAVLSPHNHTHQGIPPPVYILTKAHTLPKLPVLQHSNTTYYRVFLMELECGLLARHANCSLSKGHTGQKTQTPYPSMLASTTTRNRSRILLSIPRSVCNGVKTQPVGDNTHFVKGSSSPLVRNMNSNRP